MSQRQDAFEDRLLIEEFRRMLAEMDRLGVEAPDGAVLDQLEGVVLGQGMALLRAALQAKAQLAVEAAEKKTRRPARTAKRPAGTRAPAPAR